MSEVAVLTVEKYVPVRKQRNTDKLDAEIDAIADQIMKDRKDIFIALSKV